MKKARADFTERVAMLQESFREAIDVLEGCFRYYNNAEKQLERQLKRDPVQFRYEITAELEQVNCDLRTAVASYRKMVDKGGDQGAAVVAEVEASTFKASKLLTQLMELTADSARKVRQVLETASQKAEQVIIVKQPPQPAKFQFGFSGTLKHSHMVLSEGNTRTTYNGDQCLAVAIAEPKLPMNAVSRISFQSQIRNPVIIGVCYSNIVQQNNFQLCNTTA